MLHSQVQIEASPRHVSMRRMAVISDAGAIRAMASEEERRDDPDALMRSQVPAGVEIFEIHGALFFGAASKFKDAVRRIERAPRVLILQMRDVLTVDATGLRALEDLFDKTRRDGTRLFLSGVHAHPLVALVNSGLLARIGEANAFPDLRAALARARELVGHA